MRTCPEAVQTIKEADSSHKLDTASWLPGSLAVFMRSFVCQCAVPY